MTDELPADNTDPVVPPAEAPVTPEVAPEVVPEAEVPLTPQQLKAREHFAALMNWLLKVNEALDGLGKGQGNKQALLLTRRDESCFWEQTGFITDKNKVYIKIGHHSTTDQHYQPIGELRDGGFYPSQASKLIWARDFSIAVLHPFVGAFVVETVEAPETDADKADPSYLAPKERELMIQALQALQAEMEKALTGPTDEIRTESKDMLIDSVRLATLRCRKLNDRLALEVQKNPEIKSDYSGAEPMSFAGAAIDFLRMKLNDDNIRRHYKGTKLAPNESTSLEVLLAGLIGKFEAVLTEPIDLPKVGALIEASLTLYPATEAVLAPYRETDKYTEAANIVLGFLRYERSKLITLDP